MSYVCVWDKVGPLNLYFVQSLSSTISVQTLSKNCEWEARAQPEWHQVMFLLRVCQAQIMSKRVCKYIGCSIGQPVDKCWIFLSNLCPKMIDLDRISTTVRQRLDRPCTFSSIGQTLDRIRTDIGQRLDFVSRVCPTAVQPPIVKEDRNKLASLVHTSE